MLNKIKTFKRLLLIGGLLICFNPSFSKEKKIQFYFGIEQDVLPYIFKGYLLSGWNGTNQTSIRFLYATLEISQFYLSEHITSYKVRAFGISYEYFFNNDYTRLWFGPGVGIWTNTFKTNSEIE
jgi:hypothetical protein